MRLAQIELALDPAPRLVLELAAAKQLVDVLPLGHDQLELDLVVELRELPVAVVAIAPMLDILEPLAVTRAQRVHELLRQVALDPERLEALDRRLDRPPPSLMLLGPFVVALAAAGMGETEHADHRRQRQALSHQRHQDHAKRQEQNEIAVGERLPACGGKRNRERRGE